MPTPLHNHTMYSTLDGLSRPSEIVAACEKNGYSAAACTDHGTCAGHVDFHRTMTAAGLKPILGMEAYQATESRTGRERDNFHLLLLAKNEEGLRNLWRLSHYSNEEEAFYYKPRVDWDLLERYSEGLVCTTSCMAGMLVASALGPRDDDGQAKKDLKMALPHPEELVNRYRSIFGEDFFIEVHTYDTFSQREANAALASIARDTGVPLVYASDAHYAFKDQWELHERVLLIQQSSKPKEGGEQTNAHPNSLYILDEGEIREQLGRSLSEHEVDEAIRSSDAIADMCEVSLPERKRRTPVFTPEEGYATNEDMFLDVVRQGWKAKVVDRGIDPDPDEEYWQRLSMEMKVIWEADLVDYFLIVRDYIEAARREGIAVGPGRGSVGGSLLAWLLGITDIDPIPPGLIFERFYNVGREESGALPDIDTDFCYLMRDWVKDYLRGKYGRQNVEDIGTVVTMGAKQALQDCARAIGRRKRTTYVDHKDQVAMAKLCDETVDSGLTENLRKIVEEILPEEFAPYVEKYPELFKDAYALQGFVKTYGGHPSGIIVADEPLSDTFPARWDAKNKKQWSQWDMNVASDLGFMKMDVLALTNLTILSHVNELLVERGDGPVSWWDLTDDDMPPEDPAWQLLEDKKTVGIFQIESGGQAKRIAKDLHPRSLEDLSLIVALNRPGPDIEGYIDSRKPDAPEFDGFIYQEEVIAHFQACGYNLQEADGIRSIMGKKKREAMEAEKPRYIERSKAAGVNRDDEEAERTWAKLESFSRYAFNKAHSYGYAKITFATLYAKSNYPDLFILGALIAAGKKPHGGQNTGKQALVKRVPAFIAEAIRMKIPVEPPCVNRSGVFPTYRDGKILLGFAAVSGVGRTHAEWIVANREDGYESIEDFFQRTQDPDRKKAFGKQRRVVVDSGKLEKLIDVGAFRSVEPETRPMSEVLDAEQRLLGVQVSESAEAILEERDLDVVTYDEIDGPGLWTTAGVVREVKESKTKKGDPMAFVTIERDGNELRFAVWKEKMWHLEKDLKLYEPVAVELVNDVKGAYLSRAVSVR